MIVALGHQSNVGKNTAGGILREIIESKTKKKVKLASFGTALKMTAFYLYEHLGVRHPDHYEENRADREIILPEINMNVVDLWIAVGTKMREIWEGTWLHKTLSLIDSCDVLIITDLRFPIEYEGVVEKGGICVKIVSDRVVIKGLDSELSDCDEWGATINNSGTFGELRDQLFSLCKYKKVI